MPAPQPLSTVTDVDSEESPEAGPAAPAAPPAAVRRFAWMAPTSPTLVYAGLALIVVALGVLAYTWSRVAGTALVILQLPYIASGGFAGIGLIVMGVLLIYLGVKRRDAWERERRLDALLSAMAPRAEGEED